MNKAQYTSNSDGKHQLPARAYLDERLLAIEEERIFRISPKYLANKASIPNTGDYTTPASEKNAKVLIKIGEDVTLLSNICKHRQSILLHGSGNVSRIA